MLPRSMKGVLVATDHHAIIERYEAKLADVKEYL